MGTAVFLAAGVMAFGAGCLARSRYERDCLVTEEYRIASEKIHGQGKTIVFLTDLHNKEFGEENSRLLETVRKVKPDAVLFGGDGMVAKRGNSDVRIPLALLTELAKELDITKSCLTHRLKKLSQMAEDIRLHGSGAMEGTGEENI